MLESDARAIAAYEKLGETLKDGKKKTRWFPVGSVPKTALEIAITRLQQVLKPGDDIAGCEWWIQKVATNDNIGFHLDKDESIASNKRYLVHPVWATILYLSDVGGGTLIFDQHSPNGNGYIPSDPHEAELVLPKKNKYAVFIGDLLHGVMPGESSTNGVERITFLMNWWTEKPEGPNCELLHHHHVHGLRQFTASDLAEFNAVLDRSASEKIKRVPLPVIDLSPGTPYQTWVYDFKLPGGGPASVILPKTTTPGAAYTLRWKKKEDKEEL